jgi:large subunit ribosomal protein L31e
MADEKIVTVNLRREVLKAPRWSRSKRAVKVLKEFLEKQVEAEKIDIDKSISEKIWKENPSKLRIKLVKVDEKSFKAELMEK